MLALERAQGGTGAPGIARQGALLDPGRAMPGAPLELRRLIVVLFRPCL